MAGGSSQRERVLQVFRGEVPARLPFVTRLEAWYTAHSRTGTFPERFSGMTLDELHKAVGVGRLKFTIPYALRLNGVEVIATLNGEPLYHQQDPLIENFPGMWDFIPTDRPGITKTRLITPPGSLTLVHQLDEQNVLTGTDPYLCQHLIKSDEDFRVAEYILERVELIPLFDRTIALMEQLGENAFVVPLLHRIPFQQVLLEYLGAEDLFFALHDAPEKVNHLISLLDRQMLEILQLISHLPVPYVEFPDNLHGLMTNPKLFQKYCLPAYQQYTEILHTHGKKVGCHVDGNARPLLNLLAASGLDVVESFSPLPLTPCLFEEAWQAWRGKLLIWGGIPSPWLEERFSEDGFDEQLNQLLNRIDRPLVLGVVDLFMRHNSIERVEKIAQRLEDLELTGMDSIGEALA